MNHQDYWNLFPAISIQWLVNADFMVYFLKFNSDNSKKIFKYRYDLLQTMHDDMFLSIYIDTLLQFLSSHIIAINNNKNWQIKYSLKLLFVIYSYLIWRLHFDVSRDYDRTFYQTYWHNKSTKIDIKRNKLMSLLAYCLNLLLYYYAFIRFQLFFMLLQINHND